MLNNNIPLFGTGIRRKIVDNEYILINGTNAVISAKVKEEEIHRSYSQSPEYVFTNPSYFLQKNPKAIPSFSLIRFAKVKNFIDGVYACVEQRISEEGHNLSRNDFLRNLEKILQGYSKEYISAAIKGSNNDSSAMLPQGFYDWTAQLKESYRQIKILASAPNSLFNGNNVMNEITAAINGSAGLKKTYEALIKFYSKITNSSEDNLSLFPPAKLPDQEFFKELSITTQSDIPEGLGKALVAAIKENRISFAPDENSGLYIRQMHELIPLILRNSAEFSKFIVNDKYAKILEEEFISQWAGTRHTHVGHSDYGSMLFGSAVPGFYCRKVFIYPELSVEPLSTCYERMKNSLVFLEETISSFAPEVMEMNRIMNNGSRASGSIGKEFKEMVSLMEGLSLISKDSIHLQYKNENSEKLAAHALKWISNISQDIDINRDVSIFTPIIRTTDGAKQISYLIAGFEPVDVKVSYPFTHQPSITKTNNNFLIEFTDQDYKLPVLVHREVRVPYKKLINDRILKEKMMEVQSPDSRDKHSITKDELDELVKRLEE